MEWGSGLGARMRRNNYWGVCMGQMDFCGELVAGIYAKCHVMWEGNKNIPGTRMSIQAVNQTGSSVELFLFTWDWV